MNEERRRFAAWMLVIATLVTLGVAVQQYYRVTLKLQDPLGGHINDFDRWMIMAPRFLHDRVDYVNDQFPTPPLSLLALAPFTTLSRPAAQFAWVCLKLPLALLVFALAAGMVSRSGARLTASAMALMVACWWLPVILDMQEGQTNFLALLPLVAALYVAQRGTSASDALAGLLIGLAIAVKVTPVVFAAYFFWKRRWVVAASALAGVAFWSLAVPATVFGWDQNLRWLEQWVGIMIVPYVTHGTVVYAMSQSFGSFALRLFSATPVFESRHGLAELRYMNLLALSPDAVYQLVRAVMAGAAIAGLVWTRRPLPTLRCPAVPDRNRRRGGVHALVLRAHLGPSLRQLRADAVRGWRDPERSRAARARPPSRPAGADRVLVRHLLCVRGGSIARTRRRRLGQGRRRVSVALAARDDRRDPSVEGAGRSRAGDGDPPATFPVLLLRRHPHALRATRRITRASTCFLVADG